MSKSLQPILRIIAVLSSNRRTGKIKLIAKINFEKKVARMDS